jgi:hypothetical protein
VSLPECRSAIARILKGKLPSATVQEYAGPLTLAELKNLGPRLPAALVTCLGVPSLDVEGSAVCANAAFAVFCLAQDTPKIKRDPLALMLAESVLAEVPFQRWGAAATKAPTDIIATNLFTTPLDMAGVAMWVVRWRQKVDLVKNAVGLITPFETFFATYARPPVAEHVVTQVDLRVNTLTDNHTYWMTVNGHRAEYTSYLGDSEFEVLKNLSDAITGCGADPVTSSHPKDDGLPASVMDFTSHTTFTYALDPFLTGTEVGASDVAVAATTTDQTELPQP